MKRVKSIFMCKLRCHMQARGLPKGTCGARADLTNERALALAIKPDAHAFLVCGQYD